MKNKYIIAGIVIGVLAIGGAYFFPRQQSIIVGSSTTSTAGANFSNAKFYGVSINAANAGANGTSTSILNTDAVDRYVTGFRGGCQNVGNSFTGVSGTGLIAWRLSIGTTTTSAPASFSSNAAIVTNYTIPTSTPITSIASSTTQTAGSMLATVWPTNTYMTFYLNATNTAVCTFGVDTIGS